MKKYLALFVFTSTLLAQQPQLNVTQQIAVQAVVKEYRDIAEAQKDLEARKKSADNALSEIKKEIASSHPGYHLDDNGQLVADAKK